MSSMMMIPIIPCHLQSFQGKDLNTFQNAKVKIILGKIKRKTLDFKKQNPGF